MDESGRPSPAPGLVRARAANTALPWVTFAGVVTVNATAPALVTVNALFATGQRPPDDDGLAGVPALVRR